MIFNLFKTRVKTFRFKGCRWKKEEDGKIVYRFDDKEDIDKAINIWARKEKAHITRIDITEIVMQDFKEYRVTDLLYTIQYIKL